MIGQLTRFLETRKWPLLILLFGVAFGVRLLMNGLFQGWYADPGDSMGADAREFDELAQNLASGRGYQMGGEPTAFRAPGFPLLLAGVYRVFGVGNYLAARVAFSLIGALAVLILFAIARHFLSEVGALACAALLAVYPHHAYYSMHFLSEPLFTLLILAGTLCLLYPPDRLHPWRNLLAGILFGAAALTRPLILLLMPLLGLRALFHYRRRWKLAIGSVALIAVAVIAVLAPWSIRNARVMGSFTTLTTNGGSTFWGSNNARVLDDPALHGGWISTEELPGKHALVTPLPTEVARDRKEWELGLRFVRSHLGSLPRLLFYKCVRLWNPWLGTPNRLLNVAVLMSYGVLLPFMLLGGIASWRRLQAGESAEWLLVFHVLTVILGALIFWGAARFRMPLEPLLLIYAVRGMRWVWGWIMAFAAIHALRRPVRS